MWYKDVSAIYLCVMYKDGSTLASIAMYHDESGLALCVMYQDGSALAWTDLGVHLLIASFVAKSENALQDLHICASTSVYPWVYL